MLYLPLIIKMIIISFHSLFCFFFALHTFLVIVVQGAYDNQRAHEKKTMLFDKLFYFDDDDDAFIPFFVFNTHSASFPFTFVHFFRFSAIATTNLAKKLITYCTIFPWYAYVLLGAFIIASQTKNSGKMKNATRFTEYSLCTQV